MQNVQQVLKIHESQPLVGYTTMRVGGPARFFCVVTTIDELRQATTFARDRNLRTFVLGGGSNIIMHDTGFDGLVMKIEIRGMTYTSLEDDAVIALVGAGELWDHFVSETVARGLHGLEHLSLIPGTVGAAPVQNIGAYGVEVKETIAWVEVFDTTTREVRILMGEECRFGYRDSIFKNKEGRGYIITHVAFRLARGGVPEIGYRDVAHYFAERQMTEPTVREVRDAVIAIRRAKLPDPQEVGTVGSFFKNPVVSHEVFKALQRQYPAIPSYPAGENKVKIPLAWVLDSICGLKGVRYGAVGLYNTQPLALVQYGGATAYDITSFSEMVARSVKEKTGIVIEREVTFVE